MPTVMYLAKQYDACFQYRGKVPMSHMHRKYGWKCYSDEIDAIYEVDELHNIDEKRIKKDRLEKFEAADVIVLQRGTDERHLRLLRFLKYEMKKPVIYEADDNYIEIPDWNSGSRFFKPRRAYIEMMMKEADGMSVTVPSLKSYYSRYNDNIHVLKNVLDFGMIDKAQELSMDSQLLSASAFRVPNAFIEDEFLPIVNDHLTRLVGGIPPELRDPRKQELLRSYFRIPMPYSYALSKIRNDPKNVLIGWGGSPTHVMDIDIVRKPLQIVMNKYRRVHLMMIGFNFMLDTLSKQRNPHAMQLRKWQHEMDLLRFWNIDLVGVQFFYDLMKTVKFDIGIAPVDMVEFNRGKSAIKILEYMAFGMYPMATKFDTYNGVMEDETSQNQDIGRGRMCANAREWEAHLYDVLNNKEMRDSSITHNHEFVRKHYNIETYVDEWDKFYRSFI